MPDKAPKHLYLPRRDRSFWKGAPGSPLSYLAWGRRDFADERIPVSRHEGWVCVIIEEGRPTLLLSDQKIILSSGELLFVGPDCGFGWESKGDSDCKFCLWMWPELSSPRLQTWQAKMTTRRLPQKKRLPFLQLHEQCRKEVLNLDAYSRTYLIGCRMQFEAILERTLEVSPSIDLASARIEQATEWMSGHLDSREPIARLCDYLNFSQSSLHRLFKERLGCSPAKHFHRLRMDYARRRLADAKTQVKEVAFELGYEHFNDFSRAFKRAHGICPRARTESTRD